MITKEELTDWLMVVEREKSVKSLEKYIDKYIKENVLNGKYKFSFDTEEAGSNFGYYWYDSKLSEENQEIVQNTVIDNYKKFGFEVTVKKCIGHRAIVEFRNVNKAI